MAEERDLTRKQRMLVAGLGWVVALPLVVGFFFLNVWVGIVLGVILIATTWDYVRRGDTAGHFERSYWGFG